MRVEITSLNEEALVEKRTVGRRWWVEEEEREMMDVGMDWCWLEERWGKLVRDDGMGMGQVK